MYIAVTIILEVFFRWWAFVDGFSVEEIANRALMMAIMSWNIYLTLDTVVLNLFTSSISTVYAKCVLIVKLFRLLIIERLLMLGVKHWVHAHGIYQLWNRWQA